MNLIPLPYRILCAFLLMAALVGGGFYEGHKIGANGVQVDWDKDKLARSEAQNKAIQDRIDENQKVLAERAVFHAQEIQKYQGAINELNKIISANRAAIADSGGLRINRTVCDQPTGSLKTTNAGQSNGANQSTIRLPEQVEKSLLDLAEDADRETGELKAKVQMCQQFAKDNGFSP